MMKSLRTTILFAFIISCLIIISACGGKDTGGSQTPTENEEETPAVNEEPAKSDPVTLSFTIANTADLTPYQQIFEKFNEETGHKVEIQPLPGGADYDNMLKTRFGTGDYPDIFLMQPGTKQNIKFRAEEELYDFSNETAILEHINEAAVEYQTTQDNKIYGIPWGTTGAMGIYYNKQIFAEVGVDLPQNYQELIDTAEKIKAAGYTPFYEAVSDGWPAQIFHLSGWTTYVDPAIGEEGVLKLDSNELKLAEIPELKGLLEKQLDIKERGLYQENILAGTYDDQQEQFGQGNVAMIFQIANIIPLMVEKFGEEFVVDNLGYMPFPSETDRGVAMITQPDQLMISSQGDHVDVAVELVEFMTSQEMVEYWYSEQPGIPIYKGVESKLYPAQEDVVEFIDAGQSMINIQNRLTPTFVDFAKSLQTMFIEEDVDAALNELDENYRRDGRNKRLPGFE
ncbi:ABC transporter substrate-binding protein [Bacillus solitudinis]|uniref:ABC transporter substrate-binding protein n=1 Tax=Bacillus solitudinis TaxID=2014074 RepID=UPI000C247CA4|nr:extracellular solute-binding protein [Bacillus solitudinis]